MNYKTKSTDRLFKVISELDTPEKCYRFFEDLCTIKEIQDMSQRLDTAVLLSDGMSYQQIEQKIKISTATISRVSRCLNYGTGGYKSVIEKMKESEKKI